MASYPPRQLDLPLGRAQREQLEQEMVQRAEKASFERGGTVDKLVKEKNTEIRGVLSGAPEAVVFDETEEFLPSPSVDKASQTVTAMNAEAAPTGDAIQASGNIEDPYAENPHQNKTFLSRDEAWDANEAALQSFRGKKY